MMWIAIGCLIVGLILLVTMFVWNSSSVKDPSKRAAFMKWQGLIQIGYLVLFIAAAVLFLIW